MIVAIVGSRNFTNYGLFSSYVNQVREKIQIDMIVSGGASGVDELAYRYAIDNGITFVCHPPIPEDGYPNKFFRRNLKVAEHCEFMIAFPQGKSSGTRHAISLMNKLKKKVLIIELDT